MNQMSKEDAMKHYVNELTRINANWEECMGITQHINKVNNTTREQQKTIRQTVSQNKK